ncbi:MAG: N-acyl homoserine lactonase family protein [Myxococcales bacterium]|nr:N-acyl homoserine lactonase family protein [Myxococcales bacterium]
MNAELALLGATLTASLCVGCAGVFRAPRDAPIPALPVAPVTSRRFGALTVHVAVCGWVRVKSSHRALVGPVPTRILEVLLDPRWTEFMPIFVGIVDHPEGVFLVDAGMTESSLDPAHYRSDPGTAFVYGNLLDFRFEPEQRIDRRLASLGVAPGRVRGVILTHRHSDHADGVEVLPDRAEVYVGRGDFPTHNGALPTQWPGGRSPTLVGVDGPPIERFAHHVPLTSDGAVSIVTLPGHSPGHLGLLVRAEHRSIVFAGDAAFSLEQIQRRQLAGIVERPVEARQTLDALAEEIRAHDTRVVFAHDPASVARFAADTRTTLLAHSR